MAIQLKINSAGPGVSMQISGPAPYTQTKTATPTEQVQTVTPDPGHLLSAVRVERIPGRYKDVSGTTATAEDVASGKMFYNAAGVFTEGTATGGGEESSYELLRSAEFEAHTTSTTARTIGTITTAHRADCIIFVKIRDKAGKRNSHFFGSDNLFVDLPKANGGADTLLSYCMRVLYGVTSTGAYYGPNTSGSFANTNSANGVTAKQFAKSGAITITAKYNSNYGIIDGTYIVEIYALKWPGNDSPLE